MSGEKTAKENSKEKGTEEVHAVGAREGISIGLGQTPFQGDTSERLIGRLTGENR